MQPCGLMIRYLLSISLFKEAFSLTACHNKSTTKDTSLSLFLQLLETLCRTWLLRTKFLGSTHARVQSLLDQKSWSMDWPGLCCISGYWNGCTDRVHPGYSRPTQRSGPSRPGVLGRGLGGAGDRPVHGFQLRLRCQPSQGPGASHLHCSGRLGSGGFHVSIGRSRTVVMSTIGGSERRSATT